MLPLQRHTATGATALRLLPLPLFALIISRRRCSHCRNLRLPQCPPPPGGLGQLGRSRDRLASPVPKVLHLQLGCANGASNGDYECGLVQLDGEDVLIGAVGPAEAHIGDIRGILLAVFDPEGEGELVQSGEGGGRLGEEGPAAAAVGAAHTDALLWCAFSLLCLSLRRLPVRLRKYELGTCFWSVVSEVVDEHLARQLGLVGDAVCDVDGDDGRQPVVEVAHLTHIHRVPVRRTKQHAVQI
mmetsp:Transcript_38581/g.110369  ORF Transcript_38581/g.110369 Transcript_38581/m.110369 type:complete len:242 (-) Transcript_38581:593-1318(-)